MLYSLGKAKTSHQEKGCPGYEPKLLSHGEALVLEFWGVTSSLPFKNYSYSIGIHEAM